MKMTSNHSTAAYSVVRDWNLVRFFVALILLVAASLKAYQLATEPVLGDGLLHARWFNVFVVEFELFFGTWLIFGMLPKLTWLASVVLFSAFTIVSLFKAVTGETSCGCFGNVTVNPWITAAFDMVVVGLLVYVRPTTIDCFPIKWLKLSLPLVWLVVAVLAAWFMTSQKTDDFGDVGIVTRDSDGVKTVVLLPKRWIGKTLPIIPYFQVGSENCDLKNDEWIVVLYRPNCVKCKQVMSMIRAKQISNVAYIEVSQEKTSVVTKRDDNNICLDDKYNWFFQPPILIQTNNAVVTNVYTNSKQIETFLDSISR
jgi:hypothetical protein